MKKVALALVLAFAVLGCSPSTSSRKSGDQKPTKGAPEFDLENIEGGKVKSADLKGKIAIIDFWATWCEPCWSEIPKFNKMLEENKDVQIVAITVQSPYKDIKPKSKELGIKYTVLVGNDNIEDDFGGMIGYPTTFVVTKDWKIYKKYSGALPDKDARIKKDIAKLLEESVSD